MAEQVSEQLNTRALRAMREKASPGQWRWNVNLASKCVYLECTGRGRGLEYVMDFTRWGMGGAAPRFRSADSLMVRADELTAVVPGREHHEQWYRTLTHPDAEWMVAIVNAAPLLLDAADERDELRAERDALASSVGYYESALCIQPARLWMTQEKAVTGLIEPERVADVMKERDALRARVEQLSPAYDELQELAEVIDPGGSMCNETTGQSLADVVRDTRARVGELETAETECRRLRLALRKAERALANGEGIFGDDTFISRNGLALSVLHAALTPSAPAKEPQ